MARDIAAHDPDCGVNALYAFLRLHGVFPSLKELKRQIPLTEMGASMLDLKEVAGKWGVPSVVVQASPSQLRDNTPAIARLNVTGPADTGHYVLVTNISDESLQIIDGTTGVMVMLGRPSFERDFSGYALVARESGLWPVIAGWKNPVLIGVVILELFGLLAMACRYRVRGWNNHEPQR